MITLINLLTSIKNKKHPLGLCSRVFNGRESESTVQTYFREIALKDLLYRVNIENTPQIEVYFFAYLL